MSDLSLDGVYAQTDLAESGLFQGGYINFGYWDGNPREPISTRRRLESSKALYEKVLSLIPVTEGDRILDVGCGHGHGENHVLRLGESVQYVGLDLIEEQIHRARLKHPRARFIRGAAEALPFENQSFDHVFTIEAAQHFESVPQFIREVFRVLRPGGYFVMTTFFATDSKWVPRLAERLLWVREGIDRIVPITMVMGQLNRLGFQGTHLDSIGDRVWPYYDQWIAQVFSRSDWGRNWYRCYQEGWVDYYMVQAQKPAN